ncbi:acetate non-utilizing protein 9 [Mortierella polycephala]|uniref:Succinate dehydrogenase assembly factor 3 n=1 Tax=Mortierella polycephala TaxID=41804 RepID=A0A9P6PXW8_9FUNG|nr:acetate non-utilizing protein 9 [Mortierella polycephala]
MSVQKTLIPPLTLYRQILRAHRVHLPPQLRILGDGYVKAEFHRHKDVENPLYIVGFLEQWQDYLNHVVSSSPNAQAQQHTSSPSSSSVASSVEKTREQTLEQIVAQGKPFGRKLDLALVEKMNDQQLGQLYELRKETLGLQSQQELEELAKEEAHLLEKVAATLPESALSPSSSSSN